MIVLEDLTAEVPDTNAYYFNLKKFSNEHDKVVLMYGYDSSNNIDLKDKYRDYKKIFFNNWAPCEYAQEKDHNGKSPLEYDKNFDIIYSICPYTVDWLNNLKLNREYKYIFYPFCDTLIPKQQEKQYDVIYHGGIHGKQHVDCLKVIRMFNYRYCTMTHHINSLTRRFLPIATDTDLNFKEKINLVAKTKISVCYNFAHAHKDHIPRIKKNTQYEKNIAFSHIDSEGIFPQFKTRMHEAAISKTLNLVQRDNWNIAEAYYEPEKDFIYFTDRVDLKNKIKEITMNWNSYQDIIDSAYKKAMSYTTDKFIDIIQTGKEWRYKDAL